VCKKAKLFRFQMSFGDGSWEPRAPAVVVLCPQYGKRRFSGWTCANQVKFVDCAGKITVTFSNAAGLQHY